MSLCSLNEKVARLGSQSSDLQCVACSGGTVQPKPAHREQSCIAVTATTSTRTAPPNYDMAMCKGLSDPKECNSTLRTISCGTLVLGKNVTYVCPIMCHGCNLRPDLLAEASSSSAGEAARDGAGEAAGGAGGGGGGSDDDGNGGDGNTSNDISEKEKGGAGGTVAGVFVALTLIAGIGSVVYYKWKHGDYPSLPECLRGGGDQQPQLAQSVSMFKNYHEAPGLNRAPAQNDCRDGEHSSESAVAGQVVYSEVDDPAYDAVDERTAAHGGGAGRGLPAVGQDDMYGYAVPVRASERAAAAEPAAAARYSGIPQNARTPHTAPHSMQGNDESARPATVYNDMYDTADELTSVGVEGEGHMRRDTPSAAPKDGSGAALTHDAEGYLLPADATATERATRLPSEHAGGGRSTITNAGAGELAIGAAQHDAEGYLLPADASASDRAARQPSEHSSYNQRLEAHAVAGGGGSDGGGTVVQHDAEGYLLPADASAADRAARQPSNHNASPVKPARKAKIPPKAAPRSNIASAMVGGEMPAPVPAPRNVSHVDVIAQPTAATAAGTAGEAEYLSIGDALASAQNIGNNGASESSA